MAKKTVFFALLIGVIIIGLYGCVGKGKQAENKKKASASFEATTVSTQEWKTYVSKYGFSMSYPDTWKLEEDTYALARGIGNGKVSVWIYDEIGNSYNLQYITSYYYSEEISEFVNRKISLETKIKDFICKMEIYDEIGRKGYGLKKENISKQNYYIFSGISTQNGEKIYIAMFYIPKTNTIASIKYYPKMSNGQKDLELFLKNIIINK